ncbi:unnamed protein product, partial [marine sediment metagenome]
MSSWTPLVSLQDSLRHPMRLSSRTSFDHLSHMKRTTWAGLRSDAEAAAAELRTRRGVTSLFSIGFCSGGRLSFLLGTVPGLDMSGVIGFYGWPVGPFANDTPA